MNELEITNVLGKTVFHQPLNKPNTQVDVSGFSTGVYFYQLTKNKETYRGKFIKQ